MPKPNIVCVFYMGVIYNYLKVVHNVFMTSCTERQYCV